MMPDYEDGDKVKALCEIIDFAPLHALVALDHAGKLKVDTEFLDVQVVITSYLQWSDDHEDCSIEAEFTAWRPHAAAYFKKAKSENDKDIVGIEEILEKTEPNDEKRLPKNKTGQGSVELVDTFQGVQETQWYPQDLGNSLRHHQDDTEGKGERCFQLQRSAGRFFEQ
jgi:hypothetical protein